MMAGRKTIPYDIPEGATAETAALNMIEMAKRKDRRCPGIHVAAEHNGIRLDVTATSSLGEVLARWDEERIARELRDQRLSPMRTAIRCLISTLSAEDCSLLTDELISNPVRPNIPLQANDHPL